MEEGRGLVFYFEELHRAKTRQLRTQVMPLPLRQVAVMACYASPFTGHSGEHQTYHRVMTKYWWPLLSCDFRLMVSACEHCRLVNTASHETQIELHALESSTLFDTVFLVVWEPEKVTENNESQKVLTCIDCMTGFAAAVALRKDILVEVLARKAFAAFFVPYELPRLIIVDSARQFGSLFKKIFTRLLIPVHMVAPENHKAIRNERFH